MAKKRYGRTEPRIFTKPRGELTPSTSRGFEMITFARDWLGVKLLPWQEWLLIHMFELNDDGTLRFNRALVIVGRQNGKTLLAAVLSAYWMFVDAARWPELSPPHEFEIVGSAQKLDVAMKPWRQVRAWAGPDDKKIGIAPDRVPMLQACTYKPRMVNGEVELRTHEGAAYKPRTFEAARGLTAARAILDELRKQYDYEGWSAITKSANAVYDSFLLALSNAGTDRSEVLKDTRDIAHAEVDDPDAEWFIAEWSARPDQGIDDPSAYEQANPSAGYLPGMTISDLMRTAWNARNKPGALTVEKIEVLGQWVSSEVTPYLNWADWEEGADAPKVDERGVLVYDGSQIPADSRKVLGVDISGDRRMSYVAVAGLRADELAHVEVIAQRAGNRWIDDYLVSVREKTGINEVALQGKGCAAADLVKPLQKAGFIVHEISGTPMLNAAGKLHDMVSDRLLKHRSQPALDLAAEYGSTKNLNGMPIWDRSGPVDVAPIIAVTMALYALLTIDPPEAEQSAYTLPEGEEDKDWW